MNLFQKNGLAWRGFAAALLFSISSLMAPAQENTGSITGVVTDATGAAVPAATVTASSARNPRGLSTTSDNNGNFNLINVPIGTYSISTTKQGFSTLKQENIQVTIGSQVNYSPKLQVGGTTQVIEVTEAAVSLDTTSSRTDTTINQSMFENLAKTRNFQSVLTLAPGVRSEPKGAGAGVGGIQVDGSSGLENTYYLDGTEMSDPITGALRQNNAVPLDFIGEIQIRSGGFEAEYGGATGGVINASIRSGSNAVHGSIFGEWTGASLNASDRGYWQRSPLNANLADFFKPKEDNYNIFYPGATVGGKLIRDRLFYFVGYSPEVEHTRRDISYASGARTFIQDRLRHYGVGRLDYAASSKLQLFGTYIWSPSNRNGALPSRDIRVPAPSNNQAITGGFIPAQSVSTGATYTLTPRIILSARYGYRYFNDKDGNYGLPGDAFITYNTAASAAGIPVPANVNFNNGYSNVSSTLLTQGDITTRHNVYLDGTFITSIKGQQHTFKMGYMLNRLGEDKVSDFTNGRFLINWGDSYNRGSLTNQRGAYGYYTWEDGVRTNSAVHGRNQGVYIQDQWRVTSRLTLNLGLRLENEYLPPYKPEQNGIKIANPVSFDWGSKIAPRLGGAWDIAGDGKWKLSGSFGFFYDTLKYNLAQGSFGGQFWVTHVYKLDNPNVFALSKATPGALGSEIINYDNRTVPINAQGQLDGIDPDLKPYKSRDFNISFDHQLKGSLIASVRYARKDLIRTIEDIGVLDSGDNEVYLIGNPGFGETRNTSSVFGAKTPNGQEFLVPAAKRQYDAVEFSIRGRIGHLMLAPSYTWSRLYGNYSGLGNSDESGRSNPNNNRAFDLPYTYFDDSGSQKNVYGLLGTDRPHSFKFYGAYDFRSKLGNTVIGINQLALSGTPDSTNVIYQSSITYPYGRGDLGRTNAYLQTDLLVSHEFKFTERMSMKLSGEIRNLFNQGSVLARVTQLNRANAIDKVTLPVAAFFNGYDPKKYVFAGSTIAPLNPIYGLPGFNYVNGGGSGVGNSSAFAATNPGYGAYQDFRTIRLGARFIF